MRNPPWSDNLILRHYETLEGRVDPKWLPLPTAVPTRVLDQIQYLEKSVETQKRIIELSDSGDVEAATHFFGTVPAEEQQYLPQRGPVAREVVKDFEEQLTSLRKRKKYRLGFREYGTGHYGSVYPTAQPGIVCKITSDPSEAFFIACAMKIGKWPHGIVKYHGIFRLKGSYGNRKVFILWRDEIRPNGLLSEAPEKDLFLYKCQQMVSSQKQLAHNLREKLKRKVNISAFMREVEAVWEHVSPELLDGEKLYTLIAEARRVEARYRGPQLVSAWLQMWKNVVENMVFSYNFHPGEALLFYYYHGLLLADVHLNNIGRSFEDPNYWVISDPGHAVALSNRWATVSVPELT